MARSGSSVYNLAKFGANAFTEALRQEMIGHRVRVSVVEPGTVDTELATHLRPGIRQAAQTQIEAIQPLRPEDIADAVAYIVTRDRRVAVNEILVRASEQPGGSDQPARARATNAGCGRLPAPGSP